MRTPPMMPVEVNGQIVRRPGVLDVLTYDAAGTPVVSHMRPHLEPDEVLLERAGAIPTIVKASV